MPRTLHIIKDPRPDVWLKVIQEEIAQGEKEVGLLLIQEAAGLELAPDQSFKVYVLKEDLKDRDPAPHEAPVAYPEVIQLIFQARRVITW